MKHFYNRRGLLAGARKVAASALLGVGVMGVAQAQVAYAPSGVQNVATTYTDLGTTGTTIATTNNDDANSAEQLIGFSFAFDGVAMDRFILNTNGFLKLGSAAGMAAPTTALYTAYAQFNDGGTLLGTAANDVELLSPFNYDLTDGSSPAEFRVATTGTAPNRVCTVQWKNVADKAQLSLAGGSSVLTQYTNLSFQVRMFETSNTIEFVYGPNTPAPVANNNFKYAQVGIKGTGSAASQILRVTKGSVTPWNDPAAVTFVNGPVTAGATGAFNFRQAVPPDNGRTYRFTASVANDAAVAAIQGYASVIVPANNPITLRGVVSNVGTTALTTAIPVTLTISGANSYTATQSVASLAIGATGVVAFPGISLANPGQNTVTLSVPGDGNNTNNSVAQPMETSATSFSLATPGAGPSGTTFSPGYNRYYAAKMTLSTARSITAVSALIAGAGSATATTPVGETVYGVVIDATTGAVLARSPNYVITAADINVFHTFTLSAPTTVPAGDVLVGMLETASATGLPYFPFGVQAETPTRLNTYYTGAAGSPPTDALVPAAQAVFKFPFGAVTTAPANSDIAVDEFQGYGSVAVPAGSPVSLRAVVRNGGTSATTAPLVVTLTIAGANTVTRTQTVAAPLAVGATAVVTFTGINLTSVGANTVTITVPNDDNNANNAVAQAMATSATRFSFIAPGVPATGNNGFGSSATAITLALCAKFTVNAACDITAVRAFIVADPTLVSQGATVFGVVLNTTTGAVIARSPDYVITTADLGQLHTFNLSGRVPAGDFLVGLAQVLQPGAAGFYPLGSQREIPSRSDLYYFANITNPVPPVTLVAGGGNGANTTRLMLEAETSIVLATSAALKRAVSVFPNPSNTGQFNLEIHGANAASLAVEVTNMLGQRVYSGTAKDDLRNTVDLSGLVSGIYSIKVRNGQEFIQQQISIVR